MTHEHYDFDIFNEPQQQSLFREDDYFFDIDVFFKEESTGPSKDEAPQLQRVLTDQFNEEPHIEPFRPYPLPFQPEIEIEGEQSLFHQEPNFFREEPTFFREQSSIPTPASDSRESKKAPAKSIATKNVCFNICQKTIKMIQKGTYSKKLTDILDFYGAEEQDFVEEILTKKKNFTGPKALAIYIESQTVNSKVFREFMRWFLKEKYLRHCLNGDMKDKQAYIKYKNEVILVILD